MAKKVRRTRAQTLKSIVILAQFQKPNYGLKAIEDYSEVSGESCSPAEAYPVVQALLTKGLIKSTKGEPGPAAHRSWFVITAAGQELLKKSRKLIAC